MTDESDSSALPQAPRWQPLGPIDRRVAGVLVEKAKTVPSAYPMSINAICTAANQKSNRHPLMDLRPEDVEESLERLRALGAVGLVQGYGRVAKYRHYLYEWLGVDKVELAVMAELLLRGPQTEGELRAHASRMEPVADLPTLRSILNSLESKKLVVWLTPEGRGRVVSHALYPPREMESLRAQYASGQAAVLDQAREAGHVVSDRAGEPWPADGDSPRIGASEAIHRELDELRSEVADLRVRLEELLAAQRNTEHDLQRLREELGA
jgi:uncharacterized protein YceH (UPF0502 family)